MHAFKQKLTVIISTFQKNLPKVKKKKKNVSPYVWPKINHSRKSNSNDDLLSYYIILLHNGQATA